VRNGLAKVTVSCSEWKEAVVTPLTFELPVVVGPKRHAAETTGLKSIDSKFETSIQFVNRSNQTIKVYWLDYEGKRQLRGTIKEGGVFGPQRTFLTHPWLITDKDENAWHVYLPEGQPRTVEVHEPGLPAEVAGR
jgi:hypothetical protein